MRLPHRVLIAATCCLIASASLSGCAMVQEALRVGEREIAFENAADAEASDEAFRFQGFLPDDATNIRLIAQLNSYATVMRWTSSTEFAPDVCAETEVDSEPTLSPDWLIDPLPETGVACGTWTIVSSGDDHLAWTGPEDDA